jgi:hypothetical protein
MSTLVAAALLVPAIDEAVKRGCRWRGIPTVAGRVWLTRLGRPVSRQTLWTLWSLTAAVLVVATLWLPGSSLPVGLILGGSLSNALETVIRGRVTDYVDVGFWPAFNLADVALTAGAIGLAVALVTAASPLA